VNASNGRVHSLGKSIFPFEGSVCLGRTLEDREGRRPTEKHTDDKLRENEMYSESGGKDPGTEQAGTWRESLASLV